MFIIREKSHFASRCPQAQKTNQPLWFSLPVAILIFYLPQMQTLLYAFVFNFSLSKIACSLSCSHSTCLFLFVAVGVSAVLPLGPVLIIFISIPRGISQFLPLDLSLPLLACTLLLTVSFGDDCLIKTKSRQRYRQVWDCPESR